MDEQNIFLRINTDAFIHNQVIRERKNRPVHNERYTQEFLAAFDGLVAGDYATAKIHCKRLKRKSLIWLLYEEFDYYRRVYKKPVPTTALIAPVFGIKPKKFEKFEQMVHDKLPKAKAFAQNYSDFLEFKSTYETYKKLPIKHIAVCATMSAGKSTFINALLGNDVLPARNEATTAKITSVYDRDGADRMIGFVQRNSGKTERLTNDVQLNDIEEWNSDNDVSHIFLQGDLDGIRNKNMIVAVHDTPGTNNSGNKKHHDVTMQFLRENKMDTLIFVANVEQLCTIDEKTLLKEIYEKIVAVQDIPVIFVINKADCVDTEEESLEDIIKNYKVYTENIGFKNVKVFPVSSKSARLLKMALKEQSALFSEYECDSFPFIVKKFTKRLNLESFEGESQDCVSEMTEAGTVTVDGENYENSSVKTALAHTGIGKIEVFIESIFMGVEND